MSKTSKEKRVVILMPEEVADALQVASKDYYESMSSIGRRLIIEWLIEKGYLLEGGEGKADQ